MPGAGIACQAECCRVKVAFSAPQPARATKSAAHDVPCQTKRLVGRYVKRCRWRERSVEDDTVKAAPSEMPIPNGVRGREASGGAGLRYVDAVGSGKS